jgi:cyanate permease
MPNKPRVFYGWYIVGVMIIAMMLTGVGFGGAIGPWLGGFIYDKLGSYSVAFIISLIAIGLAGVSFWIAAPRNARKLREKRLGPA